MRGPKSQVQKVTPCPTCRRVVGVWQTGFANHKSAHAFGPTPKIAKHHGSDGKWCPSSQLAINADAIFDRVKS